ncbi:hypothetical protein Cgig2_033545 [Carnegiea gigantea]|uniref:Uncharacterized protein n=1 Tax=Carnegiea gigantea TaxID=171969 RepID=A0A9Q1K1Q1_9CARY|nr:hypothetical protein Cgig2_033545 [Carnegiea gigantea]
MFQEDWQVNSKDDKEEGGPKRKAMKRSSPEKIVDDKEKIDKLVEKAMEKEDLPAKSAEKRSKKTKAGKEKCEEAVSKKAKRDDSSQQATEGGESLQKTDAKEMEEDSSVGKVEEKNASSKKNAADIPQEGASLPQAPTIKKAVQERNPSPRGNRKRVQSIPKPAVQQPDISDVHIPESSNTVEKIPNCEHEDVDDNAHKKVGEEETHIQEAPKAVPKTKKPALKSKGKQPIQQKDAQLSTGDALPEEKTSGSGQDIQMAHNSSL